MSKACVWDGSAEMDEVWCVMLKYHTGESGRRLARSSPNEAPYLLLLISTSTLVLTT